MVCSQRFEQMYCSDERPTVTNRPNSEKVAFSKQNMKDKTRLDPGKFYNYQWSAEQHAHIPCF